MAPQQTVPFVVHASGTGVAQRLEVPGSHVFESDTYPAFGGQDAHPSPLSYALGALTSCNQVTASVVAKELGIRLGELRFEIQGDLDPSVMVGGAEGNANFDSVTVRATVESDATPEQFATLRTETERRCPVSQLFIRSGLRFDATWSQAPLAERAAA